MHTVFGLLNSTPHLSGPSALPDRETTAALLHRLARGALSSAAPPPEGPGGGSAVRAEYPAAGHGEGPGAPAPGAPA